MDDLSLLSVLVGVATKNHDLLPEDRDAPFVNLTLKEAELEEKACLDLALLSPSFLIASSAWNSDAGASDCLVRVSEVLDMDRTRLDDVEKVQMVHDMIYVDDEKKKEDIADLTAPLNKIFYEENVKLHLKLKESASGQKLLEAPKAAAAAPAPEEPPKGPVDVADDAPPKPVPEPVLLSGDEAAQMWKEKFG